MIWDTTEGALTDKETELLWLVFGNPTRNSGRFCECFARFAHRWRSRQVDSRTVKITNKAQLQRWVDDYGEDSDFVRLRVRGVFPRAGSMQFIDSESVEEAMRREPAIQPDEPTVIGVDVARFGDDRSVIFARNGSDAHGRPPLVLRGVDIMTLSGRVVEFAAHDRADAVFVDEGGVGVVVDSPRDAADAIHAPDADCTPAAARAAPGRRSGGEGRAGRRVPAPNSTGFKTLLGQ